MFWSFDQKYIPENISIARTFLGSRKPEVVFIGKRDQAEKSRLDEQKASASLTARDFLRQEQRGWSSGLPICPKRSATFPLRTKVWDRSCLREGAKTIWSNQKITGNKVASVKCKRKCKKVQGWHKEWRRQWVTDNPQNPTPRSKKVRNFLTIRTFRGTFWPEELFEEFFDLKNFLRNFLTGGGRVAKIASKTHFFFQ